MPELKNLTVELGDRTYSIYIGTGLLPNALNYINQNESPSQVFLVTDDNVEPLYGDDFGTLLAQSWETELAVIPAGEDSKCLEMAQQIWERMLEGGCDRKTLVCALGGGVVGDLAGFVASTYMRGVNFWQIPTTLLAQVDSSVGGKTAIDLEYGKNVVGTFYQPKGVIIDIDTLKSLDNRQFLAGMAEVVKYGVILDESFFRYLESNVDAILNRDSTVMTEIVYRCCLIKSDVVSQDEKEQTGLRALLNYGHTFGHAIETFERFEGKLHGEAVAIGMAAAARFAQRLGMVDADMVQRQNRLMNALGMDTNWLANLTPEKTVQIMLHDKKTSNGQINLVLPERMGSCKLVRNIDQQQILDFIQYILDN